VTSGRIGSVWHETTSSLATVIHNPGLRRVNLAFAGSSIGDWAYATAIVVWAYGVGGVTAVGVWGVVRLLLMTVVTPFASTVVDRLPRKTVMVGADLIRAVLVLAAAALIWADAPPVTVFVVATVVSLAGTPFRPAVAALLPSLVEAPEELTAANGTTSTVESLAFFVGPALGGLLLTVASVPVVVVFNALTFLFSAALTARIRVPVRAPLEVAEAADDASSSADEPSFIQEAFAGFRTIWAHRDIRLVTLVYCAQTVVAGASIVFGVAIAVEMTHFGSRGVGYLDSALGVGAILGGLLAIARATSGRLASDFGYGVVFWALPLLLIAVWPQTWAAFLSAFVIGVANPVVDVNAATIIQRLVPDELLGRVFGALETGLIAAMALGSIIMPVLISTVGLRWSLAALGIAIAVIVLPAMLRLRRLDEELAEPADLVLLRELPLFAPLDARSMELLAGRLVRISVEAGDVVIREGDEGDRFYIVEAGGVTASYRGEELSRLGPGEPFGEIALLRNVRRTATVVADVSTVLLALERSDFLSAVTGNSEVSNRADDLIARRIPTY
jgi:MFS family permease